MTDKTSPPPIHDDSHAKAILKRMIYESRKAYTNRIDEMIRGIQRNNMTSKRKLYSELIYSEEVALGESLVRKVVERKMKKSKREVTYLASFGGIVFEDAELNKLWDKKLYPVTLQIIDSKTPLGINTHVLCYLSEHAALKIVRRNNCQNMSSMVNIVREYIEPLWQYGLDCNGEGPDFVVVTGEAYMPCRFNEEGKIIIKSWISRPSWTPANEAKLTTLANRLAETNSSYIISADEFNNSVYLNPSV